MMPWYRVLAHHSWINTLSRQRVIRYFGHLVSISAPSTVKSLILLRTTCYCATHHFRFHCGQTNCLLFQYREKTTLTSTAKFYQTTQGSVQQAARFRFKERSNLPSSLLRVFKASFCFTFCPAFHSTRSGTRGSCVGGLFCRAFLCARRTGKAVFSGVHPLFINPFHTASSHYACYCQWVSLCLAFI